MKFREKLEIEQLREIESQLGASVDIPPGDSARGFSHWLLERVTHYKKQSPPNIHLGSIPQTVKHIRTIIVVLGLFLGLLSGSGLLSADQESVNIFWLLGALLGAHTISLILWAALSVLQTQGQSGPLSSIWEYLVAHLINRKRSEELCQAVDRAWWRSFTDGQRGKWLLSIFSHQFWLTFIVGCCVGLLLVFTTQKFDFIWESTLLSQEQFNQIIKVLAYPFHSVGLAWPTLEGDAESIRRTWAFFIISCLLVYALLPRLVALLISKIVLLRLQNKWQLDWSLDYFIDLQAKFRRYQVSSLVVDHDLANNRPQPEGLNFSNAPLPDNALYFGLEVDPSIEWQKQINGFKGFLNDQAAIQTFLNTNIAEHQSRVIFVMGDRVADRGTVRKLKSVKGPQTWLLVLKTSNTDSAKSQAWLSAAHTAGWDLNFVVLRDSWL